jgi:TRAP-type C4-dicarboxylate transport system permease small subunit
MRSLAQLRNVLLDLLAMLGGAAIVILMLHVVADVVRRNLWNAPIPATYEIVTNYYMIALAFLPLAWLERGRGMVQVEVIDPMLGPGMLRLSDRIVAAISTLIYAALAWFTLKTALASFASGTFVMAQNVPLPTWPAYFLLPIGFALAALVTVTRIVWPNREGMK